MSVDILHGLAVSLLLQSGLLSLPLPLPLLPLSPLLVQPIPLPLLLVSSLPENISYKLKIFYILSMSRVGPTDRLWQTFYLFYLLFIWVENTDGLQQDVQHVCGLYTVLLCYCVLFPDIVLAGLSCDN